MGLVWIISLHIILFGLRKWTMNREPEGRCSKLKRLIKHAIRRAFELFTFAVYIRVILELNQFFLVSSINEIYEHDTSENLNTISFVFAILLLLSFVLLLIFTLLFSVLSYRPNEESWNKMSEYINGFKTDKAHRSFVVALQSRRLLSVVILICLYSVSLHIIIGVLTSFQWIFFIYVVALRPYRELKSNIVKILNELIFLFLLSSLNFLNKESDWCLLMAYIYMNIIFLTL